MKIAILFQSHGHLLTTPAKEEIIHGLADAKNQAIR